MTSTHRDPILVVLQLTGGNDYLNTIVPYDNPIYYDRPAVCRGSGHPGRGRYAYKRRFRV